MTTKAPRKIHNDHISFSQLEAFDTCPARYKAERIDRLTGLASDPLMDGRHIHAVIEAIVDHCEAAGTETIDAATVAELVQQVFQESSAPSTDRFEEVMVMAKGFGRRYRHMGALIETEMWVEMTLAEGIPPLVGRLDDVRKYRDEEGPFIGNTDYKSSWSAEQDGSNSFQLHLQGLLLHEAFPDMRIKVRNNFVRLGIETDWYELKPWDYENARRRAVAVWNRMHFAEQAATYGPSPGAACSYCPVALSCTAALSLREQGHLALTEDDAKKQIQDVLVLESALKTRKASIKKWVQGNGPVSVERANERGVVETIEAGFRTPAPSLALKNTEEAFERLGPELFGLFNGMSKTKLRKYENDERLEGLWTTVQGKPRFAIGKASDDEDDDA